MGGGLRGPSFPPTGPATSLEEPGLVQQGWLVSAFPEFQMTAALVGSNLAI